MPTSPSVNPAHHLVRLNKMAPVRNHKIIHTITRVLSHPRRCLKRRHEQWFSGAVTHIEPLCGRASIIQPTACCDHYSTVARRVSNAHTTIDVTDEFDQSTVRSGNGPLTALYVSVSSCSTAQ